LALLYKLSQKKKSKCESNFLCGKPRYTSEKREGFVTKQKIKMEAKPDLEE